MTQCRHNAGSVLEMQTGICMPTQHGGLARGGGVLCDYDYNNEILSGGFCCWLCLAGWFDAYMRHYVGSGGMEHVLALRRPMPGRHHRAVNFAMAKFSDSAPFISFLRTNSSLKRKINHEPVRKHKHALAFLLIQASIKARWWLSKPR